MKLRDLRTLVASAMEADDDMEVKVWLPGSRVSLRGMQWIRGTSRVQSTSAPYCLMIEGNIDRGSALDDQP